MSSQSKPPHFPEPESGARSAQGEEREPSAEELALAEALARALEEPSRGREGAREQSLTGLLETATLVKASQHFELSPEQSRRVRAELDGFVEAHLRRKERSKTRSVFARWTLRLPLIAVGLAGVLFVMRAVRRDGAPEGSLEQAASAESQAKTARAAVLTAPPPPVALLRAQAEALARAGSVDARSTKTDRATLDRELDAYRATLIASLDERLR